jgi:hypothetical protein
MPRISKEEEQRREGVIAIHKLKFVALMQEAERDFGPAFRKSHAHTRIAEEGIVDFAKPAGRPRKPKASEVAT